MTTPTGPLPPDASRHGSALSRGFLPVALITLGVVFLLGNLIPDHGRGGLIVLGLGVAFVVGRITTDRYGYAVPAGLLLGIGSFLCLQQLQVLQGVRGPGVFLVSLGLGFGLLYVIGGRPAAVWPLFPAVIMVCLGLIVLGVSTLAPLAGYSWVVSYWPAVLVLLGVWLLLRDSLPQPIRRPVAALGAFALLGYGALAIVSTVVAGGPFARASLGPPFGPPPFADSVALDAPIAAGQTLDVTNASGHTTIRATSGSTVHVTASRHVSLGASPPDVKLSPGGGGLTLEAARQSWHFPFGGSSWIEYTVDLPAGVNVRAQSGNGDIDVDGVSGEVRATTGSGQIRGMGLQHLREASTGSGVIALDGVFSEAATVRAGSGAINLRLQPGSAIQLNVRTSSGSVIPQGLVLSGGSTQPRSLSGAIGSPVAGALLTVETGSGSVLISQ